MHDESLRNLAEAARRPGRLLHAAARQLAGALVAAGVVAVIVASAGGRGVLLQRGDRDVLGDWRISTRYRTLWRPGENATRPCKQNPWPHRLPGR